MKDTYLEIRVPLHHEDEVFRNLKHSFPEHLYNQVNWQGHHYHITMAYLDESPDDVDVIAIMEKHMKALTAPRLTFDKLDVFTSPKNHVIHLAATHVPQDFLDAIHAVRQELKDAGCVMKSDFRLHVTLGKVPCNEVDVADLQRAIANVEMPKPSKLTFTLKNVDYREKGHKGKTFYKATLYQKHSIH